MCLARADIAGEIIVSVSMNNSGTRGSVLIFFLPVIRAMNLSATGAIKLYKEFSRSKLCPLVQAKAAVSFGSRSVEEAGLFSHGI